jgi:hypothetical protein
VPRISFRPFQGSIRPNGPWWEPGRKPDATARVASCAGTVGRRRCRSPALPVASAAGRRPARHRRPAASRPEERGAPELTGRILVVMKPARAASRRFLPGSPFNGLPADPPVEQFAVRDQVTHDKYGLGWVVLVEDDEAVIVDFGSRRVRILPPFARMTKL